MNVKDQLIALRAAATAWYHARHHHDEDTTDRGASVVEWVIITAVVVALAIALGVIIYNKVIDKANTIDLQ